jgi:hypothetical protein
VKSIFKHLVLWFQLENANIKVGLKVLLWLLIPFIIWKLTPRVLRSVFVQKMDSQSVAVVDTLILVNGFHSSKLGETPVVKFYKVHYRYIVGEASYQGEESIAREVLSLKNRAALERLAKGDSLAIKYNKANPGKSFIEISE